MASRFSGRISTILVVIVVALGGCAGLDTSSRDFVTAANTLAQAESDYFDEIQAASDAAYRLQATETYVGHGESFSTFIAEYAKHDDFSKAKHLRVAAMQQLQNYAAQVAAIISGASASWIADDAQSTTSSVAALLKDTGATTESQLLTSQASLIQTAVSELGKAVIASQSTRELRSLAVAAREPIARIADMVARDAANIEQDRFSESLAADQTQAIHNILHVIYEDKRVSSFDRLMAVRIANDWKPSLVTKGQAIEAALAKLQKANEAMAKREDSSLGPLAREASAQARRALTKSPSAKSSSAD